MIINLINPEKKRLINDIASNQRGIESIVNIRNTLNHRLKEQEKHLEKYNTQSLELTAFIRTQNDLPDTIIDLLTRGTSEISHRILENTLLTKNLRSSIETRNDQENVTRKDIIALNEKLATFEDADKTLDTAIIKQQLLQLPQVSDAKITTRFGQNIYLTLTLNDVYMTPNNISDSRAAIPDYWDGKPVLLPEMQLKVQFSQRNRTVPRGYTSLITTNPADSVRAFSYRMLPHPHWIARTNPCYGDFGGPITEAMHTGDLVSAVVIILLFLEQADANDTAGAYWHRWIPEPETESEPDPDPDPALTPSPELGSEPASALIHTPISQITLTPELATTPWIRPTNDQVRTPHDQHLTINDLANIRLYTQELTQMEE